MVVSKAAVAAGVVVDGGKDARQPGIITTQPALAPHQEVMGRAGRGKVPCLVPEPEAAQERWNGQAGSRQALPLSLLASLAAIVHWLPAQWAGGAALQPLCQAGGVESMTTGERALHLSIRLPADAAGGLHAGVAKVRPLMLDTGVTFHTRGHLAGAVVPAAQKKTFFSPQWCVVTAHDVGQVGAGQSWPGVQTWPGQRWGRAVQAWAMVMERHCLSTSSWCSGHVETLTLCGPTVGEGWSVYWW